MTVETFLANFGHLADAPNGVRKLREMVLGLAVRGILTEREDTDTPVDSLLVQLNKSKSRLIQKKVVRDKDIRILAPILEEFDIPKDWKWVRVSQTCFLQTGATPSRQKPENFGGDIRWLVSGDIHKGEIFDCEGRITEIGMASSNCKVLPEDSVMIALNGQGKTRATVAILRVPAACNQSLVSITPFDKSQLLPEYVFWSLRYRYYEIRDVTGQKQRRGLNMQLVGELSISLPPIEEQHRIVAKVDQLMALCDDLEARQQKQQEGRVRLNNAALDALLNAGDPADFASHWQRICANFDLLYDHPDTIAKLRAAILQLAVQGKLVPQDPNDEPAEVLLEKIKSEKERLVKAKVIKREDLLPVIASDFALYPIPASWSWNYFQDLTELVTDGEHSTPPRIPSAGIPMATAKNVRDGFIDLAATDFVSEETAHKCWRRCRPVHDDILMVCVGATTGRLAVIKNPPAFILVRSVALIRPHSGFVVPEYLAIALRGPVGQNQIWGNVKQSAQPCLYIGKIKELNVPLPPLAEQQRIVAKVDQLMALCDALEAKLNQARQQSEKLMEASVRQLLVG